MKGILLSLVSLFYGTIYSQNPYEPDFSKPKKINHYKLVWNDEFNYNGKPDSTKWIYEYGFVRNEELQWYQPKNATCKNGVLLIEGRREIVQNPNYVAISSDWKENREHAYYTSASLKTEGLASWKYGVFEIRARIDSTLSSWPAIWTLGNNNPWPANGEIDIMEFYIKNNEQSILANAAWLGKYPRIVWDSKVIPLAYFLKKDPDWVKKFHIWRMEWDQNSIKIYIDNELINKISQKKAKNPDGFKPFNQEHYLLLNLAIGSNGGDPTDSKFPISYEVDYARIYQKE
ncbi:glycoside hydrolase family 16 protein [Litoribaculum gwangyangense]